MGVNSIADLTCEEIQTEFNLSPVAAKILLRRGLTDREHLKWYLHAGFESLHSPEAIPGIEEVAGLIRNALRAGETIALYCDYDVDGIASTALLYRTLRKLDAQADLEVFVSERKRDGYGLSREAVQRMSREGVDLMVLLDCGISDRKMIQSANNEGMRAAVVDHHEAQEPLDVPYIDLKVRQGAYPFRDLSTCGVTWKLCQVLTGGELRYELDLVAAAAVCDVVPLVGENRILVKEGLKIINSDAVDPGLKALIDIKNLSQITADTIGFQIGPMLNAPGRLGTARPAFDLLVAEDNDTRKRLVHTLHRLNSKRRSKTRGALKKALKEINPRHTLILYRSDLEPGLIGLLAGRLRDAFDKPAVVVGKDNRGSCRSVEPLNIYELLRVVSGDLETYGGHAMAAGFTLRTGRYVDFKALTQYITRDITYKDECKIDIKLPLQDLNLKLLTELERLAPFGAGNPHPAFLARGVRPENIWVIKNRHVKFKTGEMTAIAFDQADRVQRLREGPVDIIYRPVQKGKRVELIVEKIGEEIIWEG